MKQIVIKIGTSTLTEGTPYLSQKNMLEITRQIAQLHDRNIRVILVSSGSITAGREVLQQQKFSRSLPEKQMLSSVGQVHLMQIWSELFRIYGISIGQLLLTRGDFINRQGYLNARNTLHSLLEHKIIPIINENDSVATGEIEFGDNDTLSALVANLIGADLLIMLTDTDGLFTANPQSDPSAKLIPTVKHVDQSIKDLAGKTTKRRGFGTGGMITKVEAAQLATESGTPTVIASAKEPHVILDLVEGKKIGTLFLAHTNPKESRKRWLLSEQSQGKIAIDEGAQEKLQITGASLLPAGVTDIFGAFDRGSIVQIIGSKGSEIARGITNYSQEEIQQLKGVHSKDIEKILGYSYGPEVIHRDNMVLTAHQKDQTRDDCNN